MPKNGCCIFKVWPGERGALGSLVGFLKTSLPRHPGSMWSAFARFLLAQARIFFPSLALERLQQQSFSNLLRWTGQLVRPRAEKCGLQERGHLGSAGEGPLCFSPKPWESWARERTHPKRLQPSYFICCGGWCQRVTSFHLLPKLLHEALLWLFFSPWERPQHHLVPHVTSQYFPKHFGVLFQCVWG